MSRLTFMDRVYVKTLQEENDIAGISQTSPKTASISDKIWNMSHGKSIVGHYHLSSCFS